MVVVRSRGKGNRVSDGGEGVLNQNHPPKPYSTLLHLNNSNTSLQSPQVLHTPINAHLRILRCLACTIPGS